MEPRGQRFPGSSLVGEQFLPHLASREMCLDTGTAAHQTATCRPAPPLLTDQHSEGSKRRGASLTTATQTPQRTRKPDMLPPRMQQAHGRRVVGSSAHLPGHHCTTWRSSLFRARPSGKGTFPLGYVPKLAPHTQVHTHPYRPAGTHATGAHSLLHTCTHIHMCMLTPTHLQAHTDRCTLLHTCTHTCTLTGAHSCTLAHTLTQVYTLTTTHLQAQTDRCTLTGAHSYTFACTQSHRCAHSFLHTCTQRDAHMHTHQTLWVEAAEIWELRSEVKPNSAPNSPFP